MEPPPPMLMDELIEEVLLRLPPDDPGSLARAALVCRRWRRLISDPCFRRRFRDLHRPPDAGIALQHHRLSGTRFVPTSSFLPRRADRRGLRAIDSRHGRVLLCHWLPPAPLFLVWDPVADEDWEVPAPPRRPERRACYWNAAVLCAADRGGCSHIDCRRDPFLVVFLCTSYYNTFACVYSSEAGVWIEHTYERICDDFAMEPAVLIAGALYFRCHQNLMIFRYDVATAGMSVIHPPDAVCLQWIVLMATEDSRIGLTFVDDSRLYLWSMEDDPRRGDWGWVLSRVIKRKPLLPADALFSSIRSPVAVAAGFAECGGFILLWTANGFFTIDPKSDQVRSIGGDHSTLSVVPYVNFCIPVLGATSSSEGPKAAVSCASKS